MDEEISEVESIYDKTEDNSSYTESNETYKSSFIISNSDIDEVEE